VHENHLHRSLAVLYPYATYVFVVNDVYTPHLSRLIGVSLGSRTRSSSSFSRLLFSSLVIHRCPIRSIGPLLLLHSGGPEPWRRWPRGDRRPLRALYRGDAVPAASTVIRCTSTCLTSVCVDCDTSISIDIDIDIDATSPRLARHLCARHSQRSPIVVVVVVVGHPASGLRQRSSPAPPSEQQSPPELLHPLRALCQQHGVFFFILSAVLRVVKCGSRRIDLVGTISFQPAIDVRLFWKAASRPPRLGA
jgi:hypothetical protein